MTSQILAESGEFQGGEFGKFAGQFSGREVFRGRRREHHPTQLFPFLREFLKPRSHLKVEFHKLLPPKNLPLHRHGESKYRKREHPRTTDNLNKKIKIVNMMY